METISIGLTVYFEDGFWHGLFEQVYRESYQVCRVTFGQEPKDDEILEILQTQFTQLSFSPETTAKQHVKIKNTKRLQRAVKKQVNQKVSSKSKELLPAVPFVLFSVSSFGGVTASVSGQSSYTLSLVIIMLTYFPTVT